MVIVGSLGCLLSILYFFNISKKNQEQIMASYKAMSDVTVVGSTVKSKKINKLVETELMEK